MLTRVSNAMLRNAAAIAVGRSELKSLLPAAFPYVYLAEGQRSGHFEWVEGDFSAEIALDAREGKFVKSDYALASEGAYVRRFDGRPNVRWWGTIGSGLVSDLAALQACTDVCNAAFIPNGTYLAHGWLLDDDCFLEFESTAAVIKSTTAGSTGVIRARGGTSLRNFFISIESGKIDGTNRANGTIALDFMSTTGARVNGMFVTRVGLGVKNGGAGSLGSFKNQFNQVYISDVGVGYRNGTLGNEIKVRDGTVTDCVLGTDDDDNTGNLYDGLAIEGFTNAGHRVSNTGEVSQRIRYISSRLENQPTSGIGIDIKAAAQSTVVIAPQYIGLSTNLADSGSGTSVVADY